MNWRAFFTAIEAWARSASTLEHVEYADGERSHDANAWCEYFVSQIATGNELRQVHQERYEPTVGETVPVTGIQGEIPVTLTFAFIALSQDVSDFAFVWSELFRVRRELRSVRAILRDANVGITGFGPTNYLQEERDDHVYSRAEVQVTFSAPVNYTAPVEEAGDPVQSVGLTTGTSTAAGEPAPESLEFDKHKIPPA